MLGVLEEVPLIVTVALLLVEHIKRRESLMHQHLFCPSHISLVCIHFLEVDQIVSILSSRAQHLAINGVNNDILGALSSRYHTIELERLAICRPMARDTHFLL